MYVFEYNAGIILAPDRLWWNYLDGLFVADVLGHFARAGVPKAAVYSIFGGEPDSDEFPLFGIIRGDSLSLRTPAWVLKMYLDYFGAILIETTSDADDNGLGLEAYGSIRNSNTLALIVINKDLDSDHTATIDLHDFISDGVIQVWDIRNDTTLTAPWNGTKGIIDRGVFTGDSTHFVYTFPKASVTALWIGSSEAVQGDVNGDGVVNILDVIRTVHIILGIQPPPAAYELEQADCGGDGTINILDVLGLVRVILGTGSCG